jgi:hypothetical protein
MSSSNIIYNYQNKLFGIDILNSLGIGWWCFIELSLLNYIFYFNKLNIIIPYIDNNDSEHTEREDRRDF